MTETDRSRRQERKSRTNVDLLAEAQRVRAEVARRLPTAKFEAYEGTEIIDPETRTAVFALRLVDTRYALVAADFGLGGDFEETVSVLIERAWEWRERADSSSPSLDIEHGDTHSAGPK